MSYHQPELLIEPYGIEILSSMVNAGVPLSLLIEPYGIEMLSGQGNGKRIYLLLIEPYGIEIRLQHVENLET